MYHPYNTQNNSFHFFSIFGHDIDTGSAGSGNYQDQEIRVRPVIYRWVTSALEHILLFK